MADNPITGVNNGDLATDTWPDAITSRLNTGFSYSDLAASQSIATDITNLTDLTLAAASVTSDPGSWFSDANDYVTVPETGDYLVTAAVGWANNGTGSRRATVKVNGTARTWSNVDGGNAPWQNQIAQIMHLAAGDDVSIAAAQNSGGNLNVTSKMLGIKRLW